MSASAKLQWIIILTLDVLDTVTNGHVSEDSQLPARNNVVFCYDIGSAMHLSYGTYFVFYYFTLIWLQSIVISLSVCASVCLSTGMTWKPCGVW